MRVLLGYALDMWFIIISLFAFSPVIAAQEVYKSTEPDGVPLFSDRNRAGAQKLEIDPIPTIKIHTPVSRPAASSNELSADPEDAAYTKVTIEKPADDSVVWATGQPVAVSVVTEPAFASGSGYAIGLRLDGKLTGVRSQRGNITLMNVDRGTHTLQAVILNASGQVVAESGTVTFHLKRHSILHKR